MHMKIKAAAEYVFTQQAHFLGLSYGVLQPFNGHGVFRTDVYVAVMRAAGTAGNHHAFKHPVRVAFHNGAIHERAGVAFVAVADDVLYRGFLPGDLAPFTAGGESSAAATAQIGIGYGLYYIVRTHFKQRLFKRGITAYGYVFLYACGVYMTAVLQHYAGLLLIIGNIGLLFAHYAALLEGKAGDMFTVEHGLFDYLLAVRNLHLHVQEAFRLYGNKGTHFAKTLAAGLFNADAVFLVFLFQFNQAGQTLLLKQALKLGIYLKRTGSYAAGTCANQYLMLLRGKILCVFLADIYKFLA